MEFNKQKYVNYCLDILLKKTIKHINFNKINYYEVNKKSFKWHGRCMVTPYIKEIIYNCSCEIQENKNITKPFVILHELGHFYDKELENNSGKGIIKDCGLEKNADNYIHTFCKENLNLFEIYVLQNFIETFSKVKITISKEDEEKIQELYSVYYKGVLNDEGNS